MSYLLNKTPHCMETPPTIETIIVRRTFFHTMSMYCTFYWMDLTYLQTKQPYTYFSNQVEKYAFIIFQIHACMYLVLKISYIIHIVLYSKNVEKMVK